MCAKNVKCSLQGMCTVLVVKWMMLITLYVEFIYMHIHALYMPIKYMAYMCNLRDMFVAHIWH